MSYLVGYLQAYQEETGEVANKILSPIACHDGEEICLAVEKLCEALDYDLDHFEPELWDALKDLAYYETRYATIDLHDSPILVDLIVGQDTMLRDKFLIEA